MTPEKAEILGLIASDGNYRGYKTVFKEFDKRRGKTYARHQRKRIVEFANTNIALLRHFISLLSKEYGYTPNVTNSNHNVFRVCITKNHVIDDIVSGMKFGTLNWFVPDEISLHDELSCAFIRGLFDGDGSIDLMDKKIPRIRLHSNNLAGLKQTALILSRLGIDAKVNGPYKGCYELLLATRSVVRFIKLIKSNHTKKRRIFKIAEVYGHTMPR